MHRRKEGREYWVFPGGGIEEGETPKEAVIREVKEETNLVASCTNHAFNYTSPDGESHPFFYCEIQDGKLKLGGHEAQRHSKENWYHPEWIDLKKSLTLTIYPEEGIKVLKDILNKNSS